MRKDAKDKMYSAESIELLAKKVTALGLATPVSILLELHRPITSIIHTSLLAGEPFGRLLGLRMFDHLTHLFSSRSNIDRFLELLAVSSPDYKKTPS